MKKRTVRAKRKEKQAIDPLIAQILFLLAALIIADLFTILYFQNRIKTQKPAGGDNAVVSVVGEEYKNPEAGNLRSLKIGGTFSRKLPVFKEPLKFKMYYDRALAGPNDLRVLEVCCPSGYLKDYYTAEMPWAFILYDFEPGLPTVTLFEIEKAAKTVKFEIVILDKTADEQSIKSTSVTVFIELLKQYMPGYEWMGSVRKEIM
jgi:hypothetical protein